MQRTPEELRRDFWDEDTLHGGVIQKQYEEIKYVLNSMNMAWVEEQYKTIKAHAIKMTEYYKNLDVAAQFPVMNKMLLIKHQEECVAKGGFKEPTHVSSTSGSTGTPFSVVQDFDKRKRTIADLKVFGELCDYPSHERMVFFRIINSHLHRTAEQEDRENIYYVDSSDLSLSRLNEMYHIILELKPKIVFSYSSTLIELGKFILSIDVNPKAMHLTSVLCGGEGISEENRLMLERAFGCKVYRRYSNMELGILGQDNGEGGAYTLNWGSFYFECLQMDKDEPTGNGEVGRIVVTDLFNYAFPMIRYDTGDLGIIGRSSKGQLPYFREIFGRQRDCIYTVDGELLSPAKISVMMWGTDGVHQWQFIQEKENEYNLKLNCDNHLDYSAIVERFKSILGQTAKIQVSMVDEIPVTASNKRRAVICNYKKGK